MTHLTPAYSHPPTRPIFVPGLPWIGVLVVGLCAQASPALLSLLHYWTSRGVHASFKRDEEGKVLQQLRAWGRKVIHVFERGSASGCWMGLLLDCALRFVLRFKGWWSVASLGREPWYLLTSEAIKTAEDAWRLVACSVRSFQIEQTWRYDKSALAFQSPRVWSWEVRRKRLSLATLALPENRGPYSTGASGSCWLLLAKRAEQRAIHAQRE